MQIKPLLVLILITFSFSTMAQNTGRKRLEYMTLKKLSSSVPKSAQLTYKKVVRRNLKSVKPPRSNKYFLLDDNPLKTEYNKLVDEEIRRLYDLSRKYKTSKNRGEIWLRLGSRYVEKGTIIDFKAQDAYEKKLKLYEQKKIKRKPRNPKNAGRKYYLKAIQLYEWFVRDFPKDPKVAQALYFLGFSHFEIGKARKGERYFQELTARFPKSIYVSESHLALAEYYFDKESFKSALVHYRSILKNKKNRLYGFALYKSAWCHFRLGAYDRAVGVLSQVINEDSSYKGDDRRLRLKEEAIKDYVGFYALTGKYKAAQTDFYKVTDNEDKTLRLMEALAYKYSYSGNVAASSYLFKQLIAQSPDSNKAAKYQYQIVQDYLNVNNLKKFKLELLVWIDQFGPESSWAREKSGNRALLDETFKLQETTLRNQTLRLHQTAVNVKTKYTRKVAADSYQLYLQHFNDRKQAVEMRFFYAELLYDMKLYEKAADNYRWISQNAPQSKYYEKAVINNILSLEKKLPSDQKMQAQRAKAKGKLLLIPYTSAEKKFVEASKFYMSKFPNGAKAAEIEKRLGALYYAHNDLDSALGVFRGIIRKRPSSKDAPLAAEYILDIHNLRGDIPKFQAEANELLKNKIIARSAAGKRIKSNLNKAEFIVANSLSKDSKYAQAARSFESFAKKHPSSAQAYSALFNAGANFEKAGDLKNTIRMYERVVQTPTKKKASIELKQKARLSLAEIYKRTGQLEKSATYFSSYSRSSSGKASANAFNNALVIWVGLAKYDKAQNSYKNLSKKATKAQKALYSFERAELYHQEGKYKSAVYHYDQFLKYGWKHKFKSAKAMHYIGDYNARRGLNSAASKWFGRCVSYYKERPGKEGVRFAALSKLWLVRRKLVEMQSVRLGTKEKTIASRLAQVKSIQGSLIKNLADVIKFDYGPAVVGALYTEAESYEVIAGKFRKSPVPVEYAKNLKASQEFKKLASKQSADFVEKAKSVYKTAIDKGYSISGYGEYLKNSVDAYGRLSGTNQPVMESVYQLQDLDRLSL